MGHVPKNSQPVATLSKNEAKEEAIASPKNKNKNKMSNQTDEQRKYPNYYLPEVVEHAMNNGGVPCPAQFLQIVNKQLSYFKNVNIQL